VGIENLTDACPREMDDVERLMTESGGILQDHPPVYVNPGR
jgi:hypothetical protein